MFAGPPSSNAAFCFSKWDPWFLYGECKISVCKVRWGARDSLWPDDSNADNKDNDSAQKDTLNRRVVGYDRGLPVYFDRGFQVVPAHRLDLRRR